MQIMPEVFQSSVSQASALLAATTYSKGHRWYAVNTHPASEQKACKHLENQGWTTFFPRIARTIRSGRRVKTELRPHFPGYVFVQLDLGWDPWRSVDSTIGVRSLVKAGDRPVAVPIGVIETLQDMTLDNGQIVFTSNLRPGGKVRFLTGPFAEMIGALERLDAKGRVLVLLNLLGRETLVASQATEVQPLA
jgi:transcription elongation factor/antiterminator RfaH